MEGNATKAEDVLNQEMQEEVPKMEEKPKGAPANSFYAFEWILEAVQILIQIDLKV